MLHLNKKLWVESSTSDNFIIIVTPYKVIDHQQTDGTSERHERSVNTYTLLLQNKLQTNTKTVYVAIIKNKHTVPLTYSIIT